MLVLTRKTEETIHIGQDIVIKVTQIGRGKVKIGIAAPANVRVMRGEIATDHQVTNPTSVVNAVDAPVAPVTSKPRSSRIERMVQRSAPQMVH